MYLEECRSISLIQVLNESADERLGSRCFPDPYGNMVGKDEVKYVLSTCSLRIELPKTTLIVSSPSVIKLDRWCNVLRGVCVVISFVSKIAEAVIGMSPAISAVSISSVANPTLAASSIAGSMTWPIDSIKSVAINTGGQRENSDSSIVMSR